MPKADTRENTLEITITPADERMMEHVITLAYRIWPVAYAGILTPPQIENILGRIYTPENLRNEIENGHRFWLAYHQGTPMAYVSTYKEDDIIWIRKLYVDPDMQGKRVGTQLMETAIAHFLPAQEARLLANPFNAQAHSFYQRMGFTKVGETLVQMGDWNFTDHIFSLPLAKK